MAETVEIPKNERDINVPKKNRYRKYQNDENKEVKSEASNALKSEDDSLFEITLDNKSKISKEGVFCFLNDFVYLLENSKASNVQIEWHENGKSKFTFMLHSQVLSARSEWFKQQLVERANIDEPTTIKNGVLVKNYEIDDNNTHHFEFEDGQTNKITKNADLIKSTRRSVKNSLKKSTKSKITDNLENIDFNPSPIKLSDFQFFVKYLYTGDCSGIRLKNAQQLLLLASDFQVKSLLHRIYTYLENKLKTVQMDIEDVLSLIRLAYVCEIQQLKDVLKANMKDYREIFRESEAWDILNTVCGDEIFDEIKQDLFNYS